MTAHHAYLQGPKDCSTLGLTGCPETSANNYQHMLCEKLKRVKTPSTPQWWLPEILQITTFMKGHIINITRQKVIIIHTQAWRDKEMQVTVKSFISSAQWHTQEYCSEGGSTNSVEDRGQRERGSGGR